MIRKRNILFLALVPAILLSGCKVVNTQIKDIPIESMDALQEKYIGKEAWTRTLIIDLGQNGVIDRDVEVSIVSLDMHWNGAVSVRGPNNRILRHALNIERPLTMEKYEEAMEKAFWFKKPDYRYRMNLRKYGKRTAKSIYNHELFKGMEREAALESWGYPDEMKTSDIGGILSEQWIYRDPRQKTKKRYVWLIDNAVDKWEE